MIEKIDTRILRHDAKSDRKHKRIEDKTTKRNQIESRCELTQMECAGIIEEKREAIDSAKVNFLKSIKLPTDKIKNIDTDKEREKKIKNIARTIERWDTGKTKPPAGYSRRISAHEFKEWVEERESQV